jgi:hypothetical protein
MKKPSKKPKKKTGNNKLKVENPDDSIKPVKGSSSDPPEIYKINKRGKSLGRKEFIISAASMAGLAALGTLLKGCEKSEFDIISEGDNCTCHAVCTCNSESDDEDKNNAGHEYTSQFNQYQQCTCDTVCTCNTVCTCDVQCSCDSHSSGGGGSYYYTYYYTYWYPN